jgi:hypothetical protein
MASDASGMSKKLLFEDVFESLNGLPPEKWSSVRYGF